MNTAEIRELLDVCSAGLRLPTDARDEMIWTATLGDLPFGVVRAAVIEWLRTSPFWPKPAELRERCRLISAEQERDRAKRKQLAGRVAALEAAVTAQAARERTGANMIRHILGRLADAGQDIRNGKFLGVERAIAIAEEAIEEWLAMTEAEGPA